MSEVPWAEERRALVLTSRGWRECIGMAAGRYRGWVWTCPSRDLMGDPSTMEVFETTRDGTEMPTALLPGQCPRCYLAEVHAPGCMVAANLARGVPEFWAPWAMWVTPPNSAHDGLDLYWVRGARLSHAEARHEGPTHVGLVAIGPDGPTLAPWGL